MKQSNQFYELFSSPLLKTDNVTRFSGISQNRRESLSDHITDVCSLSYLIGRKLLVLDQDIDLGKLLERCVVHDMDEVLVGDIPRLTKYATKTCHDELNKIADMAASGISKEIDGTDFTYNLWKSAKDDSAEGFILKVVDILSVVNKTVHEIDFSGNINFIQVAYEASMYVSDLSVEVMNNEKFNMKSRVYLSTLLSDASNSLNEIIKENKKKADSYKVINDITNYLLDHRHKENNEQ